MIDTGMYTESVTIRFSEIDPAGYVSVIALLNHLQDTALNHVMDIGSDLIALKNTEYTWVLTRLCLRMFRYPSWRSKVRIDTWLSPPGEMHIARNFRLLDEKNELLGVAVNSAMLLDLSDRKAVPLSGHTDQLGVPDIPPAMDCDFSSLLPPSGIDYSAEFDARRSDMDFNRHVNNVSYIGWILETIPENIIHKRKLACIEINFRAEMLPGETAVVETGTAAGDTGKIVFGHRLFSKVSGRDAVIALTEWA